jgi:hypothetical protein
VTHGTNKEFAERDAGFRAACEAAKIPPTARQASKFRNKLGKVWSLYAQNHRNGDAAHIDMGERIRNT